MRSGHPDIFSSFKLAKEENQRKKRKTSNKTGLEARWLKEKGMDRRLDLVWTLKIHIGIHIK